MKMSIAILAFTMTASAQTTPSWDSGAYVYDGTGNIIAIGTDHYGYDASGRLVYGAAATPQSPTNAQTYRYDRYGNLEKVETTSSAGVHASGFAVQPLTNQLTGDCPAGVADCIAASYDHAGNQLGLIAGDRDSFQWDALGLMKELHLSTRHEQYVYDADDERIVVISTAGNTQRYSLRGADDKIAREALYDPSNGGHWTWSRDYVYRGGSLMTEFTATGQRHYHLDHLGTPRLVTDSTGFKLATHKYWPFGQEAPGSTIDASDRLRFTGHERDAVDGAPAHDLDYMHARYYGPVMARFVSADPAHSAEPESPQSWNRYAYVMNNPLKLIDPTGMYLWGTCAGSEKQCQADRTNFENARQSQLQSSDPKLREAAEAYGDPGKDNGVVVSFATGKQLGGYDGDTEPIVGDQASVTYNVRIKTGLSKENLTNATVHEGEHVRTAKLFGEALKRGVLDPSLNLKLYDAEMAAYFITWAFARTNGSTLKYNGMTIKGMMPKEQLRQEIDKFLKGKPYFLTPKSQECQFNGFSPCG